MAKEQRRGRKIAMAPEELDTFLEGERTCRVATVGADGRPHNTPLWYVWDGTALWLTSIVKSQRWADIERDPRVSVIVDGGTDYMELCGAELIGTVERVGEAPRSGEAAPPIRAWAVNPNRVLNDRRDFRIWNWCQPPSDARAIDLGQLE